MKAKYNWDNIQENGFDDSGSLFEFIVQNYSVAQLTRDYKEQRDNYVETPAWVDKLYSMFEDEIHSHVNFDEANELAKAQGVTGYEEIKTLHVNRALSLIVQSIYQWNETLFEKNPAKRLKILLILTRWSIGPN